MSSTKSSPVAAAPTSGAGRRSRLHDRITTFRLGATIAAIGVVYGDIGTSPLYALNLLFSPAARSRLKPQDIVGGISVVIWALILVIALKYAILVLRADNDGEGGVFALYGLVDRFKKRGMPVVLWMLLLGAGLLLGDGMITPAISVLSATEGLAVATPMLAHAVIPLTLVLLTALFAFQHLGSAGVGRVFGPIMVVWFLVIATLGCEKIPSHPEILNAFDPLNGLNFLVRSQFGAALTALGAVVLVLTGGEAMYADLGHFGAGPIRSGWFLIVLPCLVLNYLGQGAALLGGHAGDNLFFDLVPKVGLYPMVMLATLATVIASQALISGAFSLIAQAIALGVFPRLQVKHTHHAQAGEVYVPFINWGLYVGCASLVLAFGSSAALGAAYGLAESGVMLTTSMAMIVVAREVWKWGRLRSLIVFGGLGLIDTTFITANSLKFLQGGYAPIAIGATVFIIMNTWRWGRKLTYAAYSAKPTMTVAELIKLHRQSSEFIERTAILMVPAPVHPGAARTPTLLQLLWDRFGVLPRHLIFVQVTHPKIPYVRENRYSVTVLDRNQNGSLVRVELRFGFMEDPNVESVLEEMISHAEIDLSRDPRQWVVHVVNENLLPGKRMKIIRRIRLRLFKLLRFVSRPAYYHYGLGDEVRLAAEILPIHVR